jgi:hypothetical protein
LPRITVSARNPHFLATADGAPFFINADSPWLLAWALRREDVSAYLRIRKSQGFNTVMILAFRDGPAPLVSRNVYGDPAFQRTDGRIDPTRPLTTPGGDPRDPAQYDHWDHLDYVIDEAGRTGMYVVLLPTWGSHVAGTWDGKITDDVVFEEGNAYVYGRWLGARYRERTNIIWSMGGDRSAVYPSSQDHRAVWRALAEGIADGVNGDDSQDGVADYGASLMTYHPRKFAPNSSAWFQSDPWLDLASIQDAPNDQLAAVSNDWSLAPTKPTWLMEGRYECWDKVALTSCPGPDYTGTIGPWQIRVQAYQTVFAGGAGHAYGAEPLYAFPADWRTRTQLEGALDMAHLHYLMTAVLTADQYFAREPDQSLLMNANRGATELYGRSDLLIATRGREGDYALIYSANGRDIAVDMSRLSGTRTAAYWFNPRSGLWRHDSIETVVATPFATVASGPGASDHVFDPPGFPGDGNDWVLWLAAGAAGE